ncbi:hypothetical protein NDU88_006334 [Pleurodeles waltl]|uniref:Uncharacterized protein n=1 Tax=Pleurodeles waltl TaxID=8319 RepID=A0AAV7RRS8_PLEWA|nr:hypothetical protein NDU88_006334 [Pleurodeles waltl]
MRVGRELEVTRWRLPGTPGPGRPGEHPWASPRLTEGNTGPRSNLTDPRRAERRKKQADGQCWRRWPGTAKTL